MHLATFLLSGLAARSTLPSVRSSSWQACAAPLMNSIPSGWILSSIMKAKCSGLSPIVAVYWNVIMEDNTLQGGNISDSTIHRQIKVLNQDFAPVGLLFELAQIKRVKNPTWYRITWANYSEPDSEERRMKDALGVKAPNVLNIYSAMSRDPWDKKLTSWAYIPQEKVAPEPSLDGVVLNIRTLASETIPGHTLTHEVGHWAGLRHTFEGGCSPVNDEVDDTPAHMYGSARCSVPVRSTCDPQLVEPANNFMNVVKDGCMKSFTPGQIRRMRSHLEGSRGIRTGSPTNNLAAPSSSVAAPVSSIAVPNKGPSGPENLLKQPIVRLFPKDKVYDITDDPILTRSSATQLYAEGGKGCIVIFNVGDYQFSCKSEAEVDILLAE